MNLQEHWNRELLPDMYDLCFASGRVINFNENACLSKFNFKEDFVVDFKEEGYEIDVYESVITPTGFKVHRGAGAMGNVGFAAYEGLDGKLIWSLMLSFSNPFWAVEVVGNLIIARTEIDYIFKIPIDHPEEISCVSENPWGY